VAPIYAGILGLLALLTSLAHATIHAAETDSMLMAAWLSLLLFAALGYLIGRIAARTVEESVRAEIQAELDASAAIEAK
jgi:lipoprotein signal peptidase